MWHCNTKGHNVLKSLQDTTGNHFQFIPVASDRTQEQF